MPPRLEERSPGWRVPGGTFCSPGTGDGRQPGIIRRTLTSAGGRAAERRGGVSRCGPGSRVQEGAAARHVAALSAVTLSDMDGQGERAHCRRSVRYGRWPSDWLRTSITGCLALWH